jgi:hypothetical protein
VADDPLYRMKPGDPDWWPAFADEAESLYVADTESEKVESG